MIRAENIRVRCEAVEPEPIWMDVDGVHFPLLNETAFIYKWSRAINGEEKTNELLRPQIMSARAKWIDKKKSGANSAEHAAQTL